MQSRFDYYQAHNDGIKAMAAMEKHLRKCGLEHSLLELVKMRASQINGCAYCLDMHSKDALAAGEDSKRLFVLPAWREAGFYTERERAALAWTEAVTRLDPLHGVPDAVYEQARAVFSEDELIDLNMAVIGINSWNRLAIPFRSEPGHYQPGDHKTRD